MRTLLIVAAGIVGLVAATLAVLYLLYPVEFIDTIRFFPHYNPFVRVEPVSAEELKSAPPLDKSVVVEVKLAFTGKDTRRVLIYLPKGYRDADKERRYPTLYLLHGTPGTEVDWLQGGGAQGSLDEAIEKGTIPPVIAVFPNGNGGIMDDSEYINSPNGQPNEDFIVRTVVGYVDKNYPTRQESDYRAIGGLSEGGFGALNLGLRHQDVFGSVIALSGYGHLTKADKVTQGSPQAIHDNSPLAYIPELKTHTTRVLLIAGRQDEYFNENQDIERLLKKQDFVGELQVYDGSHTWDFWRTHLKDGLVWWGKQLPAP
jgi:enterochelin esterase-like enzyme